MRNEEIKEELLKKATDEKTQLIGIGLSTVTIVPTLIYAATHKSIPIWLKVSLTIIGIATFISNINQYIKIKRMTQELKKNEQNY